MKNGLFLSMALVVLSSVSLPAATFNDSTGDVFTGAGGGILDISSVEVNNTATDLIFKINLTGNPTATDWGKYMIGIDSALGGDPAGNGWGRPIGMSGGMDFWLGGWADGGNGLEVRNWSGAAWGLQSATYGPNVGAQSISKDASSVTISVNFAALGLSIGNPILFDVYASGGGGGDGAVDALSNPNQTIADWGNAYNSGSQVTPYTLLPVPEPATVVFLGLGAAALLVPRLRRR